MYTHSKSWVGYKWFSTFTWFSWKPHGAHAEHLWINPSVCSMPNEAHCFYVQLNLEMIRLALTLGILSTSFRSVLLLWRAEMFSFLCLLLFCINTEPHIHIHSQTITSNYTQAAQSSHWVHKALLSPLVWVFSHPSLFLPFHYSSQLVIIYLSLSLRAVSSGVQAGEELAVHWTLGHMARPGCEEGMLVWCFREVANCDSQEHYK